MLGQSKSRHDSVGSTWAWATMIVCVLEIILAIAFSSWSFGSMFHYYGHGKKILSIFVVITYIVYVGALISGLVAGVLGLVWFFCWMFNFGYAFTPKLLSTTYAALLVSLFSWCLTMCVAIALFVIGLIVKTDRVYYGFIGAIIAFLFTMGAIFVVRRARLHSEASEHALLGG